MKTSYRVCVGGLVLAAAIGCGGAGGPTLVPLSGTVTFKGQPVPAGYISFTPGPGVGSVRVVQIKNGKYDTAEMGSPKGVHPGPNAVRIAGFDGKVVKYWGQGKQIFNPVDDQFTVPTAATTKDFVVPDSAGQNVRIEPTADE